MVLAQIIPLATPRFYRDYLPLYYLGTGTCESRNMSPREIHERANINAFAREEAFNVIVVITVLL